MNEFVKIWTPVFVNDVDALIPEVWAQEALMELEATTVALNFVYRDFENEIASFGDTVNAHKPGKFTMKRKWHNDDLVDQDVAPENVPVVLNQHLYTSFVIKDGEEALSFKNLRNMYLVPALSAISQGVDLMILSQVYHFLPNAIGKLGTALGKTDIIDVETKFNTLNVPPGARYGLITPQQKGQLSNVDMFTSAEKIGDDGTAIRSGSLGQLFGTQWIMAQNAPTIAAGNTVSTTAITTAGAAAGATSIPVTAFTTEHDTHIGGWLTVAGDMTPQKIVGIDAGNNELDISPGLRNAVVDTAAVTIYVPGALDAGFANGYLKPITYDGFSVSPQAGQLMSISTVGAVEAWNVAQYASLQGPSTTTALLDVPLEAAALNNAIVGIGPAGNYGLCMHPNAIALVTRPLPQPAAGAGALSFVASYNDLSIRVVITYDGKAQGHRVAVDMLAGIKVLDTNLAIPLLS